MTDQEMLEQDFTLREGDKITIPKGWRVECRGGNVSISGPGCMAESRRGFSWSEFVRAAAEIGRDV